MYIGSYYLGQFDGYGIYIQADESAYKGTWYKNKMSGEGIY